MTEEWELASYPESLDADVSFIFMVVIAAFRSKSLYATVELIASFVSAWTDVNVLNQKGTSIARSTVAFLSQRLHCDVDLG